MTAFAWPMPFHWAGTAIEGVVDVQGQELGELGGLACRQRQVLVEQLEAVGQRQEGADGDEGMTMGMLIFRQAPRVGTVDLGGLDQVAGNALQAGDVDDHHVTDLLPAHQDDQPDEAGLHPEARWLGCTAPAHR